MYIVFVRRFGRIVFTFSKRFENYSTITFTIVDKHQRSILPDRLKKNWDFMGNPFLLIFTAFYPVIKLKIAVSLSRHFPIPYSTKLQLYMKIQLQLLLPVRSTDILSAVNFTLKLLAHTLNLVAYQKPNRRTDITGSRLHRKLEIETISLSILKC